MADLLARVAVHPQAAHLAVLHDLGDVRVRDTPVAQDRPGIRDSGKPQHGALVDAPLHHQLRRVGARSPPPAGSHRPSAWPARDPRPWYCASGSDPACPVCPYDLPRVHRLHAWPPDGRAGVAGMRAVVGAGSGCRPRRPATRFSRAPVGDAGGDHPFLPGGRGSGRRSPGGHACAASGAVLVAVSGRGKRAPPAPAAAAAIRLPVPCTRRWRR